MIEIISELTQKNGGTFPITRSNKIAYSDVDPTSVKDKIDATDNKIGVLTDLDTTDKTSVVDAINENVAQLSTKASQSALDTANTTIAGHTTQLSQIPNQTYITEKAKTVDVNNALALKANQSALDTTNATVSLKADTSYVDNEIQSMNNVVQGFYPTASALTTAFPSGNTNNYVVVGGTAEVSSLTITAIPTTAGNVTVTLNGVAKTVAVDPATDTTTALIATKIRNTAFTGWTTGGTGSIITFTSTTIGVQTDSAYSAGTTGATGTMTTTTQGVNADNYVYRWNGSVWSSTGYVFNANGIADNSVAPSKTSFLQNNYINLIDDTKCTYGQAVSNTTGALSANASYKTTEFIAVTADATYSISHKNNIAFYDSSKVFVIGWSGGSWNTPFVIPSGCSYLRTTLSTATVGKLNSGSTLIDVTYEEGRFITFKDDKLEKAIEDISTSISTDIATSISATVFDNKITTLEKNSLPLTVTEPYDYVEMINMYNQADDELANTAVNATTGAVYTATNYVASGLIPVVEGEYYCASHKNNMAWYDADGIFVSGVAGGWSNPIQVPTGVKFARLTFSIASTGRQFSRGTTLPTYEAYGITPMSVVYNDFWKNAFLNGLSVQSLVESLIPVPEALPPVSQWEGDIWDVLGDSISDPNHTASTIKYFNYISESKGMTVSNYGIAGTTISTANPTNSFVNRYMNMNTNAKLITVFGGVNDYFQNAPMGTNDSVNIAEFKGALNVICQGLYQYYPNAKYAFFTPMQRMNDNANTAGNKVTDYVQAVKDITLKWGIPCYDTYHNCNLNFTLQAIADLYAPDKLHPNNAGHLRISTGMGAFIESL